MASPAADLIVLDTLGKLHAHGHGLNGYCRVLIPSGLGLRRRRSQDADRVDNPQPSFGDILVPQPAHRPDHLACDRSSRAAIQPNPFTRDEVDVFNQRLASAVSRMVH
jgi:hypothetical protein